MTYIDNTGQTPQTVWNPDLEQAKSLITFCLSRFQAVLISKVCEMKSGGTIRVLETEVYEWLEPNRHYLDLDVIPNLLDYFTEMMGTFPSLLRVHINEDASITLERI